VQLSEVDASPGRRPGRWLAAALATIVAGAVATRIVGVSLTPRTNAVIALCVFGGLLGLVLILQRRMPRDRLDPQGDDTGSS
jgi:hypothetical protein